MNVMKNSVSLPAYVLKKVKLVAIAPGSFFEYRGVIFMVLPYIQKNGCQDVWDCEYERLVTCASSLKVQPLTVAEVPDRYRL